MLLPAPPCVFCKSRLRLPTYDTSSNPWNGVIWSTDALQLSVWGCLSSFESTADGLAGVADRFRQLRYAAKSAEPVLGLVGHPVEPTQVDGLTSAVATPADASRPLV